MMKAKAPTSRLQIGVRVSMRDTQSNGPEKRNHHPRGRVCKPDEGRRHRIEKSNDRRRGEVATGLATGTISLYRPSSPALVPGRGPRGVRAAPWVERGFH